MTVMFFPLSPLSSEFQNLTRWSESDVGKIGTFDQAASFLGHECRLGFPIRGDTEHLLPMPVGFRNHNAFIVEIVILGATFGAGFRVVHAAGFKVEINERF